MPDEAEAVPAFPGRSNVDTSALAKWYLNEEQSDRVDEYLRRLPFAGISSLTLIEKRSPACATADGVYAGIAAAAAGDAGDIARRPVTTSGGGTFRSFAGARP